MNIIALTTPTCVKCKSTIPKVQELCESKGVDLQVLNAMSEGKHYVEEYGVTSVPTFLVRQSLDSEVSVYRGDDAYHELKELMT